MLHTWRRWPWIPKPIIFDFGDTKRLQKLRKLSIRLGEILLLREISNSRGPTNPADSFLLERMNMGSRFVLATWSRSSKLWHLEYWNVETWKLIRHERESPTPQNAGSHVCTSWSGPFIGNVGKWIWHAFPKLIGVCADLKGEILNGFAKYFG